MPADRLNAVSRQHNHGAGILINISQEENMKSTCIKMLFLVCCLLSTALATEQMDSVSLKNGSMIKGHITGISINEKVKIETAGGSIFVFNMPEVAKIHVSVDSVFMANGNMIVRKVVDIIPGKHLSFSSADGSKFIFDTKKIERIVIAKHDKADTPQQHAVDTPEPKQPAEKTVTPAQGKKEKAEEKKPAQVTQKTPVQKPVQIPGKVQRGHMGSGIKGNIHLLGFCGAAFSVQMIDEVIENSTIGNGPGYSFGAGIAYKKLWITASYTATTHTFTRNSEEATMSSGNIGVNVGYDLAALGKITPFAQGVFTLSNLTDKESDGFKSGMGFGFGAGIKIAIMDNIFFGLSGIYSINSYNTFEIADFPAYDTDSVSGNYLQVLGHVIFDYSL